MYNWLKMKLENTQYYLFYQAEKVKKNGHRFGSILIDQVFELLKWLSHLSNEGTTVKH